MTGVYYWPKRYRMWRRWFICVTVCAVASCVYGLVVGNWIVALAQAAGAALGIVWAVKAHRHMQRALGDLPAGVPKEIP